MRKFIATRFPGVFYRELASIDQHTKRRDRTFYINVPDEFGHPCWMMAGRQSQGMTAAAAARMKAEHLALGQSGLRVPRGRKGFTFGEAVEAYTLHARANGKYIDKPLDQYVIHCKRHIHTTRIDSFTPEQAEALKLRLMTKNLSSQSVHHALSFLKRVVNFAMGMGHARHNPFAVVAGGVFHMPRLDNRREKFLTPAECQRLLEALRQRSPQTWRMALLSLHTGMRATEIFRLRYQDIHPAAGCLHIRSKGGQRETVHAPQHILDMLMQIPPLPGCDLVFPMPDGRARTSTPATFQKVVRDLGMQVPKDSPYRITFHTFRHTFASLLAQSGKVDIHELMRLMRHHSVDMTMRYAHLIPSETAKKIDLITDALNSVPPGTN